MPSPMDAKCIFWGRSFTTSGHRCTKPFAQLCAAAQPRQQKDTCLDGQGAALRRLNTSLGSATKCRHSHGLLFFLPSLVLALALAGMDLRDDCATLLFASSSLRGT